MSYGNERRLLLRVQEKCNERQYELNTMQANSALNALAKHPDIALEAAWVCPILYAYIWRYTDT